jgi:hypothetical protein
VTFGLARILLTESGLRFFGYLNPDAGLTVPGVVTPHMFAAVLDVLVAVA